MTRSRGVSTFVATLILVSISLSLSYVVYGAVSRISPPEQEVFANEVSEVGGSPPLWLVEVNASTPATPVAFEVGGASSRSGVLYFDGSGYGTTGDLCLPNATTFFSVYTTGGELGADGDGQAWIDGYRTDSLDVQPGWQEVMFADTSSCSVTGPGGAGLTYPGPLVSTIPIVGDVPSSTFELYVPTGGNPAPFLMIFDGSYDSIA